MAATKDLTKTGAGAIAAEGADWRTQLTLVKSMVASDLTEDEFQLFIYRCNLLHLDPLQRQIHAWKSRGKLSIQVGIDGFRSVANRTNRYVPGSITWGTEEDGTGRYAEATIHVLGPDDQWHSVARRAYWDEFAKTDPDGNPIDMWLKMPRLMLGKCAEAQALRATFPDFLAGVYEPSEMDQANMAAPVDAQVIDPVRTGKPKPAFQPIPLPEPPEPERIPTRQIDAPRPEPKPEPEPEPQADPDDVPDVNAPPNKETSKQISTTWATVYTGTQIPVWTKKEIRDQLERLKADKTELAYRELLEEIQEETLARLSKKGFARKDYNDDLPF